MSSAAKPRCRKPISSFLADRKSRGGGGQEKVNTLAGGMTRAEVDAAWQQLLEETLPPDKQEALNETYQEETSYERKYQMLLEFSSYLRQSATNSDDSTGKARRPIPPGARGGSYYDDDGSSLCWEISRVFLIVGAIVGLVLALVYYVSAQMEGEPTLMMRNDNDRDDD